MHPIEEMLLRYTCGFPYLGHAMATISNGSKWWLSARLCMDLAGQGRVHVGMRGLGVGLLLWSAVAQALEGGLREQVSAISNAERRVHWRDAAAAPCAAAGIYGGAL